MNHLKSILIIILITLRMMHGSEIHKVSSIIVDGSALSELSGTGAEKSSVSIPAVKKKVRISLSSQERKIKYKKTSPSRHQYQDYSLLAALLHYRRSVSYFHEIPVLSRESYNSLYRFHPF